MGANTSSKDKKSDEELITENDLEEVEPALKCRLQKFATDQAAHIEELKSNIDQLKSESGQYDRLAED